MYIKHVIFQSTRPPRASTFDFPLCLLGHIFQSTRPSRASTFSGCAVRKKMVDFNPQGPRGPRPQVTSVAAAAYTISIHKALAGLDQAVVLQLYAHCGISIHKALAGLDITGGNPNDWHRYDFNPQGPRGPRLDYRLHSKKVGDFNPQGPRGPRHSRFTGTD